MHPRAAEFADEARARHGVDVEVHEFDDGTKTARDAAAAIGCDVAQIGSSIVFVVDEAPVVVVTSGANRVDEDRLAGQLSADSARLAEADEVREATGWSIGGVPPFCHDNAVEVYLDETLLGFETVWLAAGTPEAVFPLSPDRLVEITGADPIDVAE